MKKKKEADLKSILQIHGYRVTPGRLAILAVFAENGFDEGHHMPHNAEYVARRAKKAGGKNVNEVTVYRTLSAFEKSGILKRVDLRKDSAYFELVEPSIGHHHHIVCTECGDIEDFDMCDVDSLMEKIATRASKFKLKNIKEHSLELFGLCRQCV